MDAISAIGVANAADSTDSAMTTHGTVGDTSARRENAKPIPANPENLTTVLLPSSEIEDTETAKPVPEQNKSKRDRFLHRMKKPYELRSGNMLSLRVRQLEYEKYFAKNEVGQYREEPPGGRKEWIKQRLDEQKAWK